MSTHATLSPSARHRWGACPGSVREEAKFPESKGNAASIDGTHTHTLLDVCVKNNAAPKTYVGQTLTDHDGDFVVDADRAERVQFALDYIDSRPFDTILAESRVDPAKYFGRDDLVGTVDVQLFGEDWIELIDYKDGMNPVAANCPQLDQYGFGVLAGLPDVSKYKMIHMTIIQPKLRVRGMTGITSYAVRVEHFLEGMDKLKAQADATDAPDAPLVPGEDQCKYCRAKGSCNALSNQALASAGVSFQDLSKQSADKEPTQMTDAQIREILEAAPLIRQMIEGVEKEAMRRFEAGISIEGLKAVRGRGTRSWAMEEDVIAEKLKKMGLPKDAIWQTKLISPAQAEKVTWTKRTGVQVQLTEKQVKLMQSEYIKKSDGKLVVVPESDDRDAVVLNAAPMFQAVPLSIPSWLL